MKRSLRCVALSLFALLLGGRSASAITAGQLDNFQDGTTSGWTNGGLATPVTNIATGGPAGAGDRYIQVTANGSGGAGGRLTTFNFTTWSGNFIAAGVISIQIDLLNQSAVTLSIRLAFQVDLVQNAPGYLTAPMVLAPGSGWRHFTVTLTSASLIPVGGPAAFSTFFTNIGEVRIIHEVGTSNVNGDPVVGQLGIDNIRAVPEPTITALLAGSGTLLALNLRRRSRK